MKRAIWTSLVTLTCCLATGGRLPAAPAKGLAPGEALELKTLAGQLADPSRSAKTKVEAAGLLLTRPYPEAAEALRNFLADSSNRAAQIAVAEAIAARGSGSKTFIEPLMAMLTGSEPSVRAPAGRALVTYKNHGVTERLIGIAKDAKGDQAVRLVAISALQRSLSKQAVDALVTLVGGGDAAIRAAAADALAKLTNIRAFGNDPRKWRRWWARNKNKPASEWLADLADSLAREKARLEDENAKLRSRLATAMADLYNATPAGEQDRLLLDFLKDTQVADVRLVGVKLARRKASSNGQVTDELRAQVRAMLADEDPRVRAAAALLSADLADKQAVKAILDRLKIEEAPEVKQELLTALGQFRDPNTLGAILAEVASKEEVVSSAAASAVARLAAKQPLQGKPRAEAISVLLKRYARTAASSNSSGAVLREALLTAMGMVADKQFIPALRGALKDAAATVRLAAVRGLAQLRQSELADALAPLAADEDRGVRQAVIDALGALSGPKHLPTILQRIDPSVEPDVGVREKAWGVAMPILSKADAATLSGVCDSLAELKDVASQRIKVMEMLVQRLKTDKSPKLSAAQRKLGAALMAASRPAEAVAVLGEAYSLHAAAKSAEAAQVYLEWVDALLAAGDPGVIKAMADQTDEASFRKALERLNKALAALVSDGKYPPAILLAGEAARQLPKRLSDAEKKALTDVLAQAKAKQLAADRKRVAELTAQLLAAEAAARGSAAVELKAMGTRAVEPLVMELKKAASANKPNPQAEKAILDVLMQIAPKLTGYDPGAPKAERLARIEAWLKVL